MTTNPVGGRIIHMSITYDDFQKVDIRLGRVISSRPIEEGRYSTHKLEIDFGDEVGLRKSCARLTGYPHESLEGQLVLAVLNFEPKQIGHNISEVLVLGLESKKSEAILVTPDRRFDPPPLGAKLY